MKALIFTEGGIPGFELMNCVLSLRAKASFASRTLSLAWHLTKQLIATIWGWCLVRVLSFGRSGAPALGLMS